MIDSSLFGAKIPAGTYAVGDTVKLDSIDGPSVVRSGRGSAILKRIMGLQVGDDNTNISYWRIHVKNSDWIDDAIVFAGNMASDTILDQHSAAIRIGNNTNLTPNSTWEVWAECLYGVTTTGDNSIAALIDVDYPQVSSIVDPDALMGIPASIPYDVASVGYYAPGNLNAAKWDTFNIDILKAGYQYALQEINMISTVNGQTPRGFIKISNAAGMGGLARIVPVSCKPDGIKQTIQYASLLVKGPMDLSYMVFRSSGTDATTGIATTLDFVKRRV